MRLPTSCLAILSLSTYAVCVYGEPAAQPADSGKHIAIIGAGAGSSSAAYWISLAKQRWDLDVNIDVYEERNYIGGREFIFPVERLVCSLLLIYAEFLSWVCREHHCCTVL